MKHGGSLSERREAISVFHGKSVVVRDASGELIGEFNSILKSAAFLEVSRDKVSDQVKSGKILETKLFGPVLLTSKGGGKRSNEIQVLDAYKNVVSTWNSLRACAKHFEVAPSTITTSYLNQNRLFRGKYYFVKAL